MGDRRRVVWGGRSAVLRLGELGRHLSGVSRSAYAKLTEMHILLERSGDGGLRWVT